MHGYIPDVCIFVLYHLCKWNVPTFWVILLHLIINMSALPKFWDAFNFHSYSCIIILVQSYLFLKCFSERIWRNSLMKNIISIQKDEKKKMHLITFLNGVFGSQPQGKKKKKRKVYENFVKVLVSGIIYRFLILRRNFRRHHWAGLEFSFVKEAHRFERLLELKFRSRT